jgi:hypothetical protein
MENKKRKIKLNNSFDFFYNLLSEIDSENLFFNICNKYLISEKMLIKLILKTIKHPYRHNNQKIISNFLYPYILININNINNFILKETSFFINYLIPIYNINWKININDDKLKFIIKNNLIEFKYLCKYIKLSENQINMLIENSTDFEWEYVFKYLKLSKLFKQKYHKFNRNKTFFDSIFSIF